MKARDAAEKLGRLGAEFAALPQPGQ
jgi:hypothetical protein